jgi:DNA-directed RNA polymerase subunit H
MAEQIKHYLVPEHVLIKKEVADKILADLGLKKKALPKMDRDDAAIKFLNPIQGDIVKIIRTSETAGESVYYRRVV